MRKYAFFFHYNKPASLKAGRNKLTVHWRGLCMIVDGVNCRVPIVSKDRKSQPRCVMAGKSAMVGTVRKLDGRTLAEIF